MKLRSGKETTDATTPDCFVCGCNNKAPHYRIGHISRDPASSWEEPFCTYCIPTKVISTSDRHTTVWDGYYYLKIKSTYNNYRLASTLDLKKVEQKQTDFVQFINS